ncbi:MAG TPA: trypsin-like peptidase domain-containing protein [Candidatus Pullichristensenella stercorigallinarum]|uniref:Trypsin-like peptidase domain-containing protein n=1 Tax=Candidatus Pullichristensenella stercorigallinarum TaxID=2840909 RepID=A0A9D0ZKI9_9FIRM|nr:trypsin-like peptidase domain-containing protein [Candidatus Pullichristensenella stercorigallinarum]
MRKHSIIKQVSLFLALALCLGFAGGALLTRRTTAAAETDGSTTTYDAVYSSDNPIPEIAANVRPSVVQVITSAATWDGRTREVSTEEIGYGSGTYIRALDSGEGGYILTNNHVIDEGESYQIQWLDGTIMDAELVGADDGTDIAILQFNEPAPDDATPVPLGDSDALQIGELAIVIGNPGSGDEVLFGTVTAGIISGLEREGVTAQGSFTRPVSTIQVDASINTGNSGGALLNAQGELVGIPTIKMTASYTTIYEGLGFCIPINTAKDIIDQLIENGEVVRPRLGVTVTTVDGPDEPMRNYAPAGVQVVTVEEGSPAEAAGLQAYDIITEINGERIYSNDELIAVIDQFSAGDTVELTVCRYYNENGTALAEYEELTVEVELQIID